MRRKIIAGNWKMNGTITQTEFLIKEFLAKGLNLERVTVIVCPPFTSLYVAANMLKDSGVALGAQDTIPASRRRLHGGHSCRYALDSWR